MRRNLGVHALATLPFAPAPTLASRHPTPGLDRGKASALGQEALQPLSSGAGARNSMVTQRSRVLARMRDPSTPATMCAVFHVN